MKGETNSAGFTIVETLIVLGITSVLFVLIMITLGGKQNGAQFQQAVRSVQTKIQQTMNEVSTGYYPDSGVFSCAGGPDTTYGTGTIPTFSSTPEAQGKNAGCIFLGKIMTFKANGAADDTIDTYTVAGLSSAIDDASAHAMIVDLPEVTQTDELAYGLKVKSMCYNLGVNCLSPLTNATNSIAFISSVGSLSSSKTYEPGSVNMVALTGAAITSADTLTKARIAQYHLLPPGAVVNPSGGVSICFQSGATNQTAVLTIGANGHNLAVKAEIKAC